MRVAIAGASGLIGGALIPHLTAQSFEVVRLVRPSGGAAGGSIAWEPSAGAIDSRALDGTDCVICLSGESIAARWTAKKKKRLWDSRVESVSLLARTLASLKTRPTLFISASAVGYYGERGDAVLTEDCEKGMGFLSDLCEAWESAAAPAVEAGIRTVHLRFGVVLDPRGGFLKNVAPIFKLGLGGVVGPGSQYMSWISVSDVLRIIDFVIRNDKLAGPINAVSPEPVTNRAFTRELARVLHRPAVLPVPAVAVRLLMGEAGENLALCSTRAVPRRLEQEGFEFVNDGLGDALKDLFERE